MTVVVVATPAPTPKPTPAPTPTPMPTEELVGYIAAVLASTLALLYVWKKVHDCIFCRSNSESGYPHRQEKVFLFAHAE